MKGNIGVNSPLAKWQIALVVGAPVALGLGYMYYKNSFKSSTKVHAKSNSLENGGIKEKQISIDGDSSIKANGEPEKETPLEEAIRHKNQGNEYFKSGRFDEAIANYNKAIEVCPKEDKENLATFYQNRAAAYEKLKKYSAVKSDCSKALELNPKYTKALLRRAQVNEELHDLEGALEDVTAVCILERFSNQRALIMADRVLKELGRKHVSECMAKKKPIMPSKHFIKQYSRAFHKDPIFSRIESINDTTEENILTEFDKAKEALRQQKYDDIIPLCTKSIESVEMSDSDERMEVLLLRGTFYTLLGLYEQALSDFTTIVNSEIQDIKEIKANALIKRSILYMQLENVEKCYEDFDKAIEADSECSDIYHHRGQINLLHDRIDEAKADFSKAVTLNPNFGEAYVQKCYTDYRYVLSKGNIEFARRKAAKDFEVAFQKFPDCSECYMLYAQMLRELQDYEKADEYFAKAIEKDPENATIYVHRGLLQMQWEGNVQKAVEFIDKAIEMDEKCEFGYETLGSIEVQRGNLEKAIKLFDKAIELGRTPGELTHLFSLRDAAKTQLRVTDRLGKDVIMSMQAA